jgi:hypothetical protein
MPYLPRSSFELLPRPFGARDVRLAMRVGLDLVVIVLLVVSADRLGPGPEALGGITRKVVRLDLVLVLRSVSLVLHAFLHLGEGYRCSQDGGS